MVFLTTFFLSLFFLFLVLCLDLLDTDISTELLYLADIMSAIAVTF